MPIKILLAFLLALKIGAFTASAATPIGQFEALDGNGFISGWALDPDAPSIAIDVHIYMDSPSGSGIPIGKIKASLPHAQGRHGFHYPLPPVTRDGIKHSYWLYGIDTSGTGSDNRELGGSPRSAALNSTIVSISNGVVKVGIEPRCGGTIAEITVNGTNLVNNYDCTGRQIQVAYYDGNSKYDNCAACTGVWGWNPVQGGDVHGYGSVVLEQIVTSSSIYIKTQPYEWFPDDKGGGPGAPVLSDVIIEQWLSFVPSEPYAIKMRSKATHLGNDSHSLAAQEHPATYINLGFDRLVYYGGSSPWTNGAVNFVTAQSELNATENWSALINIQNSGVMIYTPGVSKVINLQRGGLDGFSYVAHVPTFAFSSGSILEKDIYIITGDYASARQTVYRLKSGIPKQPNSATIAFSSKVPNQTMITVK